VVRLPHAGEDLLAAAFARVPWEIARLPDGTRPHNLVVRAVTDATPPGALAPAAPLPATTALPPGETLRVLAVFAEAPGSRPLAMRREREQLQRLFAGHILPRRKVEIDLLCHGVTRDRLKQAIRTRRGYHLVHWSGHGHHNALGPGSGRCTTRTARRRGRRAAAPWSIWSPPGPSSGSAPLPATWSPA